MRKIYSLVLIAAGLLIGTQVWAQTNTCKIGSTEYPSVAAAIAAVPANDVPTTIQMIADEDAGDVVPVNNQNTWKYVIPAKKNVNLDLNGKKISGHSSNSGQQHIGLFKIEGQGTLTIFDGQNPTCDTTQTLGEIDFKSLVEYTGNTGRSTIYNYGTLNINGGKIMFSTSFDYCNGCANYVVDAYPGSTCNVTNGYIWSTVECFRAFANSEQLPIVINLIGGNYYGYWGLVFAQDPSGSQSGKQTINISGGNYTSDHYPLVRVYTTGENNMQNTKISLTGDIVCNQNALMINHTSKNNLPETLSKLDSLYRKDYSSVFDITGGTYKSENYEIRVYAVLGADGEIDPTSEFHVMDYTLPTLIDGALYRDSLHSQSNEDGTITVIPLWKLNLQPTDGAYTDLREPTSGLTVKDENVEFKGIDSVYSLVVENADAIVKSGTILNVGPGGVQAKNGGRIIVEAGGILKVGEYGFEGADANSLVVYSNTTASGIVAISPMAYLHNTPALKIVMNSNAYTNPDNYDDYYWQFFAIPTSGNCHFQWSEGAAPYMKRYDVGTQTWINITNPNDLNTPFVGYAMTNDCPARGNGQYTMTGNLVGRENAVMKLTAPTAGDETGWNLFGNSYLAPIDVDELIADIKVGEEFISRSVYAYNSYNGQYVISSKTVKGTIVTSDGNKSFTSIAPMSAFFLENKGTAEAGFTINYAKTVYGKENIEPMMAPARSNDAKVLNIHVQAGKYADDLYFVQNGDEDDNVTKLMNDNMNIYALVGDKKQISVNADNMSNMPIAFQAGQDVEYTMTISNNNCDGYVLVDHLTNAQVAMTDGATYTFVATPNETTENRFEIRKAGGVVTNLAEMKAAHAVKGIYTAAGQYVGKADRWSTLPAGMYIVDGVRMAK